MNIHKGFLDSLQDNLFEGGQQLGNFGFQSQIFFYLKSTNQIFLNLIFVFKHEIRRIIFDKKNIVLFFQIQKIFCKVNPQIRLMGLIWFPMVQMWVLLEFVYFFLFF